MLLYSVPKSLNFQVKTILPRVEEPVITEFEGDNVHARLMGAEQDYRKLYSLTYNSKTGREKIAGLNIATATLSVLFSKKTRAEMKVDKGYDIQHFDILNVSCQNKKSILFSDTFDHRCDFPEDVINKNGEPSKKLSTTRNRLFLNDAQKRINLVLDIKAEFDFSSAHLDIKKFSSNPQFPEKIHHSEQASIQSMFHPLFIDGLVSAINLLEPAQIAALIFNLHTSLPMCSDCNLAICGCQQLGRGSFLTSFLARYKESVRKNSLNVRFPQHEVTMHSVVTCHREGRYLYHRDVNRNRQMEEEDNILSDENRHLVLQKNANYSEIEENSKEYKIKDYKGDYFLSSRVSVDRIDKKIFSKIK